MLPDPEQLAELCMVAVKTATAPLLARIHVLEQRAVVVPKDGRDGEKGEPGKDADPSLIQALQAEIAELRLHQKSWAPDLGLIKGLVTEEVATLPSAPAGKDADPAEIKRLVDQAVAALPPAKDGRSVTPNELRPLIVDEVQKVVAAIPPAKDGAKGEPGSVDLDVVESFVAAHVSKAFSALIPPKDGTSVTVDDVAPLIAAEVTKAVEALPKPKDGISVVNAIVNHEGRLVQTFSDGATKDAGPVVGRDGRDADPVLVARLVVDEVAKIPRPKDGRDGTFENIKVVQQDERTWAFCFKDDGTPLDGDAIRLTHPLDRGVWRETGVYKKGDGTTFGGSWFIAQRDDPGKPEVGDGWRLAVKRGRDGQSGKDFTAKAK